MQTVNDATNSNVGLLYGGWGYIYDANGNLTNSNYTLDATKNKSTTYNLLNMPLVATVPTGTVSYTYDAGGKKLRKAAVINSITTNTDYIDGIEYDNSTTTIGFIQTEEGKAIPNGATAYNYEYFLSDHLGNTRVAFDTKTGAAVKVQADDYYPFGMEIAVTPATGTKNEYLYNRKELQEELGQYDYGARFYDPVIGRWNVIDPLSENSRRWSPYNYGEDDPVRMTDPDGMTTKDDQKKKQDKENEIKKQKDKKAQEKKAAEMAKKSSVQKTPLKIHYGVPMDPTAAVKSLSPKVELTGSVGIQGGIKTPIGTVNFAPLTVDAIKVSASVDAKSNATSATGTLFNSNMDLTTGKVTSGNTSNVQSVLGFSALQSGGEVGLAQKIDAGLNPPTDYTSHTQFGLLGATQTTETNQNNQVKVTNNYVLDFGVSFILGIELKLSFGGDNRK